MKVVKFVDEIKGSRINLIKTNLMISDAEDIYPLIDNSREHLSRWFKWVDKTNSAEDYYNGFISKIDESNKLVYKIKSGDKYVGTIDFSRIDWQNKQGVLGYWLDKDCTGNGYVSEAVKLLEEYLFSIGFNEIIARCLGVNIPSKNVIEKSGYKFIENLENYRELYGKKYNLLVYSKCKS